MATGSQVPWNDPGEAPCCCTVSCAPPSFTQASLFEINAINYAAMYAGGVVVSTESGSVSATSNNVLSGFVCSTERSEGGSTTMVLAANQCISSIVQKTSTSPIFVSYQHFLKHENGSDLYQVFFELQMSLSSTTKCNADITTSVSATNGTFIQGNQGVSGSYQCGFISTCLGNVGSTSLDVSINNGTNSFNVTVPSFMTAFSGGFPILQNYTAVSGNIIGTFTYTPSAP